MRWLFIWALLSVLCPWSLSSSIRLRVSSLLSSSSSSNNYSNFPQSDVKMDSQCSTDELMFKKRLESLLSSNSANKLELEAMYNEYIASRRDHYFEEFCNTLGGSKAAADRPAAALLLLKDDYVNKFKIVLNNTLPLNCPPWWDWQGVYQEFVDDITAYVEEVTTADEKRLQQQMQQQMQQRGSSEKYTCQQGSIHHSMHHPYSWREIVSNPGQWLWLVRLKKSKYYSKYRWLAVQLSLLAVKFAQNDFVSRTMYSTYCTVCQREICSSLSYCCTPLNLFPIVTKK